MALVRQCDSAVSFDFSPCKVENISFLDSYQQRLSHHHLLIDGKQLAEGAPIQQSIFCMNKLSNKNTESSF